ncbi:hypothetical protein [Streptomyces sp. NPDC056821]|uniref:hypothetical protein n=1 Tax=unclassified Streptomyces TaxID=2593676 RepID=UPI003692BAAE
MPALSALGPDALGLQDDDDLAVENPAAPLWNGRLVVRAAGRPDLHVGLEGVIAPAMPVFTVPLECAQVSPGPWQHSPL